VNADATIVQDIQNHAALTADASSSSAHLESLLLDRRGDRVLPMEPMSTIGEWTRTTTIG
jgi:hypothetical protein